MITNLLKDNVFNITPYEPGKPIEEVRRQLGLDKVIKLASNENPLGPSPEAIRAIKKSCKNINRYPDGSCFYLRKNLAEFLNLSPDNLLFGNGSDEIIDIIIKTFLSAGEEVLSANITFLEYKIITQINAGIFKEIAVRDFKYDLRAMKDTITDKTKIIFIANPNNPTGTYVNQGQIEQFLEGLPESIIVVFDEAYKEFVDIDDFPKSLRYLGKNVIVLRTFSKAYGLAGLRIGYAVAKNELIKYMQRLRQPFNVNYVAQVAAKAALSDEKFLRRTKGLVLEEKEYLYSQLERLRLDYIKSVANFILIDLKKDGRMVSQKLLKYGVIVRDMKQYGLDNYIRVTVGRPKENRRFIEVLKLVLQK